MLIEGQIISGEFDSTVNEFSLRKVKNVSTVTTIKENQLTNLYHYLKKHENDIDGQIITLYDQIPILLTQEEVHLFLKDLDQVQSMYH
ncbi:hypothetical protein [Radiobacillus deserti]|uniref:Uncharacterized protein n=1 Tax=Radiobacillus deserti TaxID=2594883 RepID=A0A516KKL1_9BACI|nr:hypothetical protein [Radiobacillus deserti]QDP41930.1 hypothetical protein FN924_18180 [Radiobacillus deserti]